MPCIEQQQQKVGAEGRSLQSPETRLQTTASAFQHGSVLIQCSTITAFATLCTRPCTQPHQHPHVQEQTMRPNPSGASCT